MTQSLIVALKDIDYVSNDHYYMWKTCQGTPEMT